MVPLTVTEGMTVKTYIFEGFREAVWWLKGHILEIYVVFEPRHCHLLAMTKLVHLFTTLSRSYKGVIIPSLLDDWDCDIKHWIKCQEYKRLHTKQKYQDSGEGGSKVETVLMVVIRHELSVSLPEGVVSFIHLDCMSLIIICAFKSRERSALL